ncbi:hypothetical protein pb186bvf_017956 [Paramecium bursaria]
MIRVQRTLLSHIYDRISKMIKDCLEFNNKIKFKLVYFLITLSIGIKIHYCSYKRKKFIGSNFKTLKMKLIENFLIAVIQRGNLDFKIANYFKYLTQVCKAAQVYFYDDLK